MRSGLIAAAALACLYMLAGPVLAQEFKRGDVRIERPWSRATQAKVGGAYMRLSNSGTVSDRLVKVESPLAEKSEIHETRIEGDMATMRPAGMLALEPGAAVKLEPGGLHVMLLGLRRPLEEGERIKLVLTFERAGTIEVEATVEKAGARAPGGQGR